MWLKDNFVVLRSLLALAEQLKRQSLPHVLVLNLEGISTPPTYLTVTLQDNLAYSDKERVLNLITLYRDIEDSEEIVTLFETLKSYVPLVSALHTYSQSKRGLILKYTELLQGVVTMSYYDYSVRLVHDYNSLLSNVTVSTYSDSANYFELETQGAQGNALTVQLSVDEQTELTLTSKKEFVPLKSLTDTLDSMFSDLAQYKAFNLTLT